MARKDPKDQAVVQFARTSAQSAENARALAMGAVGGLLVRQLESELAEARAELATLRIAEAAAGRPSASATKVELPEPAPAAPPPLVKQPALWLAVVFRGRSAREAEPFVESLRRSIADRGFVLRSPDRPARKPRPARETKQTSAPRVNISIGIAERSKRHSTPELVLDAADATLYRAKEAGRNCLKLDESTPSSFAVKR